MDLVGAPYEGTSNFNTAPRQKAWIVRENAESVLEPLKSQWWLIPNWVKSESYKYSMFNARSETVEKSPAFRGPFRTQRCVVPVTGFYEWVDRNGKKQPYYVNAPDQHGLMLAGLWDRWINPETEAPLESFTILTTDVDSQLKFLHRRQPVMLSREGARVWMASRTSRDQLKSLLTPCIPYDMKATPVSTFVSNVRNRGVECMEPIGEDVPLQATI